MVDQSVQIFPLKYVLDLSKIVTAHCIRPMVHTDDANQKLLGYADTCKPEERNEVTLGNAGEDTKKFKSIVRGNLLFVRGLVLT